MLTPPKFCRFYREAANVERHGTYSPMLIRLVDVNPTSCSYIQRRSLPLAMTLRVSDISNINGTIS
jgi:hypothetical protein